MMPTSEAGFSQHSARSQDGECVAKPSSKSHASGQAWAQFLGQHSHATATAEGLAGAEELMEHIQREGGCSACFPRGQQGRFHLATTSSLLTKQQLVFPCELEEASGKGLGAVWGSDCLFFIHTNEAALIKR